MITRLRIRGLGVIAAAELDICAGMVAFTGETGAGKTMVVSALGLILGDRFETALVGPDGADIEAALVVPDNSEAAGAVRAAGGRLDPAEAGTTELPATPELTGTAERPGAAGQPATGGLTGTAERPGNAELIVTRSVSRAGRGRAAAGGTSVPVALLAEIGTTLAQRHSQSDQIALRSPRRQREALDRFGGPEVAAARAAYAAAYEHLLAVSAKLAEATRTDDARRARVERLRADVAEIADVDPQPAEERTLDEAITRLTNAEELRIALETALRGLGSDDGTDGGDAASALSAATVALATGARRDPGLAQLQPRLAEAQTLVADVAAELRERLTDLTNEPESLADLHLRKARLSALLRGYGGSSDAAIEHRRAAEAELAVIDAGAEQIDRLTAEVAAAVTEVAQHAEALSRLRQDAARRLAEQVSRELAGLAMPQARFEVSVTRRDDPAGLGLADGRTHAFGPHGVDVVGFRLQPHAGASPVALGEGASGGELSRIMLALEVVLSASAPPGIYVFDEVDAGIGGRTAVEVGRRLARLARRSQVFVVTHLPQVASFADQHIVVRKDSDGVVTQATVAEVTGSERTAELSRMLSGLEDSQVARIHAEELLDLAALEARRDEEVRR